MVSKIEKEDLVSIIMPTYNCADFIGETIESVLAQDYKNWELIVVDDCSTDDTENIVEKYRYNEERIKYHRLEKNSGAAIARNTAIDLANGRYIAFLDSDDLWVSTKLSTQIYFMKDNNYYFTCTKYNKIDEKSKSLNRIIKVKNKSDYNGVLKTCPGNSTVIYDSEKLGKFKIDNIKKRNDYVMWLQVIKKARYLYGIDEVLGSHRIRRNAISSKKISLVKYHWIVYRNIEKLSVLKTIYLIFYWIIFTAMRLR